LLINVLRIYKLISRSVSAARIGDHASDDDDNRD
jgi:hypothetical protein